MPAPATSKKILFIITKSYFGGAQRYVFELALAMKEAGYLVSVACGPGGELIDRLKAKDIPVYILKTAARDIGLRREWHTLRAIWQVIDAIKPDIVHLNSSKAGGLGAVAARFLRVPRIIFTVHGWPFQEPRHRLWRTLAWLGSYVTGLLVDHVIVVSQNDLQQTKMPGVRHKTTMIYTALPDFPLLAREEARAALFSPAFIKSHNRQLWLVTHGEINQNKNHSTAINALAEYNSTHGNQCLYIIIGSGDAEPALVEQVALKGLIDYVHFMPPVREVRQFLLAFDIYLMPSRKEGLPYSLLEAGYAGLPVIASAVGGIPEVVIAGETGTLTDSENHLTITTALENIINNPNVRDTLTSQMQSHIDQNFKLETMIAATKKVYCSSKSPN